jgi:hypothetical protein
VGYELVQTRFRHRRAPRRVVVQLRVPRRAAFTLSRHVVIRVCSRVSHLFTGNQADHGNTLPFRAGKACFPVLLEPLLLGC